MRRVDRRLRTVSVRGGPYLVCARHRLECLSGLFPLHTEGLRYFAHPDTDRLHPNDAGQERLARTLMYQLLTLPCTF